MRTTDDGEVDQGTQSRYLGEWVLRPSGQRTDTHCCDPGPAEHYGDGEGDVDHRIDGSGSDSGEGNEIASTDCRGARRPHVVACPCRPAGSGKARHDQTEKTDSARHQVTYPTSRHHNRGPKRRTDRETLCG